MRVRLAVNRVIGGRQVTSLGYVVTDYCRSETAVKQDMKRPITCSATFTAGVLINHFKSVVPK